MRPLAILTPYIGILSETFIQNHIDNLLPNGVVVGAMFTNDDLHWHPSAPTLILDQIHPSWRVRLAYRLAQRAKLPWLTINPDRFRQTVMERFLTQHGVEVIMAEYLTSSIQWIAPAKRLGIRFFAHAHGWDVSRALQDPTWRQQYLAYNQADGIITMNQVSRKRLIELGIDPAKIYVIPYGVDVPEQVISRHGPTVVRCLAVGRMVAKKSPIFLLDSFRRAVAIHPNLHLDYIGTGELFSAAQDFVRAMHLIDHVTLHGGQPPTIVHQMMHTADIFLQHSVVDAITGDEEGLPVAILEAMARSLPIVSTHHAGIPEAVVEGETGFLVSEGDTQSMANYIVQLATDGQLRSRMGQAGYQRVQELFTWERERRALLELMGLPSVVW
jgi:glycosyltransferase involved in cell wall biosynthesis